MSNFKRILASFTVLAVVMTQVAMPMTAYAQEAASDGSSASNSSESSDSGVAFSGTQSAAVDAAGNDTTNYTSTVEVDFSGSFDISASDMRDGSIGGVIQEPKDGISLKPVVSVRSSRSSQAVRRYHEFVYKTRKQKVLRDVQDQKLQKFFRPVMKENALKDLKYVPNQVIVKFKDSQEEKTVTQELNTFAETKNLLSRDSFGKESNMTLFSTANQSEEIESLISRLEKDPNVEYVEPNYIYKLSSTSPVMANDTHFDQLWGLHNTGQQINNFEGTADADMDLPEAWALQGEDKEVIVAVIDSGVRYDHPDLQANMWDGSKCKDENGNDLTDGCKHGYDYINFDNDPDDDNGHGTHVAGTIAAVSDNKNGVTGVNWNAKIMAIKSGDSQGYLSAQSIINGVNFARHNGAKVINASFGGGGASQATKEAIEEFTNGGGLFIAAAGNIHYDVDQDPDNPTSFPCGYDVDGIICVAATDSKDEKASFSSFGTTSVDVGAPGVNTYSTVIDFERKDIAYTDFEDSQEPQLPTGFTQEGTSGALKITDAPPQTVAIGDINQPYTKDGSGSFTSPTYLMSGLVDGYLIFNVTCDTEYDSQEYTDYMWLEYRNMDGDFVKFGRFDEYDIDYMTGDVGNDEGSASMTLSAFIPSEFLTDMFKYRFSWVTNGNDNVGDGCFVDDMYLLGFKLGTQEKYDYMSGTSMAAPHVTGLASLLWSHNSQLTGTEVKNAIMTTGDDLAALKDMTVTGKRVNAYNALASVTPGTPAPAPGNPGVTPQPPASGGGGGGGGGGSVDGSRDMPTAPEGGYKIVLNNGDAFTTSREVLVTMNAGTDIEKVAMSHSEDFAEASLQEYNPVMTWTLSDGYGPKNVYVKFYTRFGHASEVAVGSIVYKFDPNADKNPRLLALNDAQLIPGDLFKQAGHSAIYYYGHDKKRHVFPTESVYYSWYGVEDFARVKTVAPVVLGQMELGEPVKFRPGVRLVKEKSSPDVYAVGFNGTLHRLTTPEIAKELYGDKWTQRVSDIGASYFSEYAIGKDVTNVNELPDGMVFIEGEKNAVYIVENGTKRPILNEKIFNMHKLRWNDIVKVARTVMPLGVAVTQPELKFYSVSGTK